MLIRYIPIHSDEQQAVEEAASAVVKFVRDHEFSDERVDDLVGAGSDADDGV